MKNNILASLLLCLATSIVLPLNAQTPATATVQHLTFSEASNVNAMVYSGNLRPTFEGHGFMVAGTWGTGEFARAMVVRLNSNLQVVWALRLNFTLTAGNSFQASYGADVVDLGDNQFVLLAGVNNFALSNNESLQNLDYAMIHFTRTNSSTTVQWAKCYGGDFNEVPHSLIKTSDNALLASGYSNPEQALNVPSKMRTYLVKTDLNGNTLWNRRYADGSDCNTGVLALTQGMTRRPVIETADGGYVFTSHCDERVYITKVKSNGKVQWTRKFVGGGSIGQSIEDADLGSVGVGAGAGGTIIGLQELPNGDLAFLGNYLIVLAGIVYDGQQQQLQGDGVALPMGYAFTTDQEGHFKRGTAFFREKSYVDENAPIEMLCQDFFVRPSGHLLVAAGLKQFGNSGEYYYPSLLELDLTKTDVDAALVRGSIVKEEVSPGASAALQYTNNDNARGQSYIHLSHGLTDGSAVLSYNFRHFITLSDEEEVGNYSTCLSPIDRTHTFPILLEINAADTLSGTTLPVGGMDLEMSVRTVTREEICSGTVGTGEALLSAHPLALTPSLVGEGQPALVVVEDNFWQGGRLEVLDLTGRVVHTEMLRSTQQNIDLQKVTPGIFLVRVMATTGESVVLKGVRQ